MPPFQSLLDLYGQEIHRLLIRLVGRQEADDCFQETYLAALRAYAKLQTDNNLRSWLYTIAMNKARDKISAK